MPPSYAVVLGTARQRLQGHGFITFQRCRLSVCYRHQSRVEGDHESRIHLADVNKNSLA